MFKNYILRYGILSAVISVSLGVLNWLIMARNFHPSVSQTVGWISIAISLLCVPLGIRYFRDRLNQGQVSFKKGFTIGLGITVVASILNGIYSFFFFLMAGDEFEKWNKSGLSEEELQAFESRVASGPDFVFEPWFQGIVFFFMIFTAGVVISLVSSTLLKRDSKPFMKG